MQSETQIHLLSVSSFYQSVALTLDSMQEGFFYAEGSSQAKGSSHAEGSSPPQNDYINAVAKIETTLSAEQLLKTLNNIEDLQGRVRSEKWDARTLDLDILLYGDLEIQTKTLTIPHSQIAYRNFVIHPLFEVAGKIFIPGLGELSALSQNMDWKGLQRL
ncbi:MAG: 2-amino-4-hydroxy-6-hydroxymethyldihydropteridine diphosphokinase [Gammaproteobacteria bacterium]|nr:2-amino-4-hydroxy-6-hydroxymethyldihydropteridine diphosphokinase [Gammaproteobacteria bacterium]